MRYSLTIQGNAGIPLACWDWVDQAITTGDDAVCDSLAAKGPNDVAIAPANSGSGSGAAHQVCIVAKAGSPLGTHPVGNDRLRTFQIHYCEADWLAGRSWASVRQGKIPARIP